MAKSGSFLESKAFKNAMAKVYGLGAAIVIVGALFKLMHWPGAGAMLIIGLGTEALIFAISAFEPLKEEVDWTLVYPELAGMESKGKKDDKKKSMTQELDRMLEDAKIEKELMGRLGDSMRSFSDNVSKMSDISDAALATNEYATKVKAASSNVEKINGAYGRSIDAMEAFAESSSVSKNYFEQIETATQKLSQLNSVYEMELEDSNNHIQALNSYYANLAKTIENISGSQESTAELKEEFGKLSRNLSALNNVYGNMLSAMAQPRG